MRQKLNIIGLHIDHITFAESLAEISRLGKTRIPGFVCFANVHMLIEAHNDSDFRNMVNSATLVLADGKPIASACKILQGQYQDRIAGMDAMPALLQRGNTEALKIFLYGSSEETLRALKYEIGIQYPNVIVAGAISPAFRPLSEAETDQHIAAINESGAELVMVSLGCPKQEKWMYSNHKRINALLLGVGGAFPVVARQRSRSPKWMQDLSLEWLYRLWQEPRRMFKRYLYTNSLFLFLLFKEKLKRMIK